MTAQCSTVSTPLCVKLLSLLNSRRSNLHFKGSTEVAGRGLSLERTKKLCYLVKLRYTSNRREFGES